MASKMFLYWGSGSPPCWRVMMALEEKGLSGYGNKLLSFDKMEHKTEEVLKWNPRGQLPTFVHDNRAVNDSLAVCEYLEELFPEQGTKFLPKDPAELGLVLQRKHEVKNFDLKMFDRVNYMFYEKPDVIDEAVAKQKLDAFHVELSLWEGYMSKLEGGDGNCATFLAGQKLSLADIAFFPSLALCVRFGLQLDPKYPATSRYYKHLLTLPSVEKTWPPHWKEGPAPMIIFD